MQSIPLVKNEFIGLHVTVSSCTDPTWKNQSGIIIDETKNTFLIQTQKKAKRIAKDIACFTFSFDQKNIRINGSKIRFRPEERVKKSR